mgnify:CR=1 FL=1
MSQTMITLAARQRAPVRGREHDSLRSAELDPLADGPARVSLSVTRSDKPAGSRGAVHRPVVAGSAAHLLGGGLPRPPRNRGLGNEAAGLGGSMD